MTLAQALEQAGLDPDRVPECVLDPATVHALSSCTSSRASCSRPAARRSASSTAIAAPHDFRLTFHGAATHSGATPMALRRDALAGAAEAMVELERLARESPSGTTVGTVGVLRLQPGAINVVPGDVELDVDVRDSDRDAREAVVDGLVAAAARSPSAAT